MTHKYYADEPSFHVAVDCIIFGFEDGNLQVLFQHRNIEPFNGELNDAYIAMCHKCYVNGIRENKVIKLHGK